MIKFICAIFLIVALLVLAMLGLKTLLICEASASINEDLMPGHKGPACGTLAVRETWGAEARLRGSPDTIQLAPLWRIKRMADGDEPVPNDGIYVAEELGEQERLEYWNTARLGWERSKDWRNIYIHQTVPNHEEMVARFYFECMNGQPGQ